MTRQEIITAMQERQILITRGLTDAIAKMPDQELAARWAGIQALAETHKPGNKPGWMGKHFGNPTTLFIGQKLIKQPTPKRNSRKPNLKQDCRPRK